MAERSADWMRQAGRDLASAKAQKRDGFHEWACFIAHQAAEKALKALLQKHGAQAWGHSLLGLLRAAGERVQVESDLETGAKLLDRYYIPARYPNGWTSGTPSDYLDEEDAEKAVGHSERILRFCQSLLARQEAPTEADQEGGPDAGE